jgi:L-lactate dehydrogenase complex protein LldG
MASARDNILARVRNALGKKERDEAGLAAAEAYMYAHAHGPRPRLPGDLVEQFIARARDMGSTVERIGGRSEIPRCTASYLAALELPPALAEQKSTSGVCWPEFATLDWAGAGLSLEARPTTGGDRLAITGCFCAIAETGTMVVLGGEDTPTAHVLLPDTHVAVVRADRIVGGMEEAFEWIRRECAALPRAVNMISGPSRTGDIEQTIVLGAHGPYRVHILIV